MTQDQFGACPWCGNKDHLMPQVEGIAPLSMTKDAYAWRMYIICKICGARGPGVYGENKQPDQEDTKHAIYEWNKRYGQQN